MHAKHCEVAIIQIIAGLYHGALVIPIKLYIGLFLSSLIMWVKPLL
jgi:hypothetical protein